MSRTRTPGDGLKCACGKPAVWSGYCQMEDGRGYCTSKPQAMTKTTAEVRKFFADISISETKECVLATDYDILQQRCRELEECVRELVEFTNESCRHCGNETCLSCLAWQDRVIKLAQSLLGGEKGVGT